ncbi:DUF4209 domain-containing protein [Pseudactinotalea sp. Z1732]|uniref:DUF4209 domain-containing protein n=1 Tax=Micrococcales TaxID=85006 RepID=UPI003C7C7E15
MANDDDSTTPPASSTSCQAEEAADEVPDASWWEAVSQSEDVAVFEAAEVLHCLLADLAQRAHESEGSSSVRSRTLTAMARATSAMLNPDSWDEPFSPAMESGGSRTVVPSDLDAAELTLLAQALPIIEPVVLRARIADVVWTYRFPRDPTVALMAADAYLAVPLTWDAWVRSGHDSYRRVVELARRQGKPGAAVLEKLTSTLVAFLAGDGGNGYLQAQVSEVLRGAGKTTPEQARALGERLEEFATHTTRGSRAERALLREASAWWNRGQRDEGACRCQALVADSYATEAEMRMARERSALGASGPLEKSLEALRLLPRKYRTAHGLEEVISQRQQWLRELRELSLEEMSPLEREPIEIYEFVKKAQNRVSGLERPAALLALSRIATLFDLDEQTESARKHLANGILRLLTRSTMSGDGRKVSVGAGDPASEPSEQEIIDELVSRNHHRIGLVVQTLIAPALEVISTEHRFDLAFVESVCRESPTVPIRHAGLWARGIWHGLNGDMPSALSLLVPQIEQMVRLRLKAQGLHTLNIGDNGVETEKALGSLLEMPESKVFLGENLAFELQSVLLEQVGPNLRNEIAHGLVTDAALWGAASVYTWWLCLHMVLAPYELKDIGEESGDRSSRGA